MSGNGVAAQRSCWDLVRDAQASDPLALVTIAVPNAASGLQLRRAFGTTERPGGGRMRGMVNVRTMPLGSVAHTLASQRLGSLGLRPLTHALHLAFVRAAMSAHPRALQGLGEHPATINAVAATLSELASATPASLDALAALSRQNRELVAIERTRRSLTDGFYTSDDVMTHATQAIIDGDAPLDHVGQVLLYLPSQLRAPSLELCRELARIDRLGAVIETPGDPITGALDAPLIAHLREWLAPSSHAPVPPTFPDQALATQVHLIVHAPEPHDELRWVAHDLTVRAGQGMPLHRAAIVMRLDSPYRRIAMQTLARAGIRHNGRAPRTLAATAAGRAALGLLGLASRGWHRNELFEWFQCAPLRDASHDGRPVPTTQWDRITREAGIVRGFEQWNTRLMARSTPAAKASHPRAASEATELLEFIRTFDADLTSPRDASWSSWSRWLHNNVEKYLGRLIHLADWPEEEVAAYERVVAAIESLATLDAAQPTATLESFSAAFNDQLTPHAERHGTFGRGVFVGGTDEIAGCSFDVVYIVGMGEGMYPPRGSENPLLRDADRGACLPGAPQQRDRAARERHLHLRAVATAEEVVYTFPRGDVREQRSFLATPIVVEAACAMHGGALGADELFHITAPWLVGIDSFAALLQHSIPVTRHEAITATLARERDATSLLHHPIVKSDAHLTAGLTAISERMSNTHTIFDGNIGSLVGLLPNRPLSPTALEQWASCPFRYFLAQVLRLRDLERPEAIDGISPTDHGTLVHEILDQFLRTVPVPATPATPWSNSDRELLFTIAQEQFTLAQEHGLTGRPLLWKLTQRRILETLNAFCEYDDLQRAERGVVPSRTELSFGFDDPGSEPAVALALTGERTVTFRGRIDRIDRAPDGKKLIVTDYKTGRPQSDRGKFDPVSGGRHLQLPIYAIAAERLEPGANVEAYFWYLRNPSVPEGWTDASLPFVMRRLHDVATHMFEAIETGQFPAVPGKPTWLHYSGADTWEHCVHCPFDRVCPLERGDNAARKIDDDALMHYRSLQIDEQALEALQDEIEGAL